MPLLRLLLWLCSRCEVAAALWPAGDGGAAVWVRTGGSGGRCGGCVWAGWGADAAIAAATVAAADAAASADNPAAAEATWDGSRGARLRPNPGGPTASGDGGGTSVRAEPAVVATLPPSRGGRALCWAEGDCGCCGGCRGGRACVDISCVISEGSSTSSCSSCNRHAWILSAG